MRRTSMWVMAALLGFFPLALAQQAAQQTNPALPADVVGPQLVAWSELQKPRPVPQPVPPPQPDPPTQPQAQPPGSQPQLPPNQLFTGTIVKDGSKYVLKVSENTSFQIDDQEKAKLYEGKPVKIAGSLDARTNMVHIATIELLS